MLLFILLTTVTFEGYISVECTQLLCFSLNIQVTKWIILRITFFWEL